MPKLEEVSRLDGGRDSIAGTAVAISLDSQDGVLIILTVILAHVAFLAVVLRADGPGDLLARANAHPELPA
jgi:hypothetical protein